VVVEDRAGVGNVDIRGRIERGARLGEGRRDIAGVGVGKMPDRLEVLGGRDELVDGLPQDAGQIA
jgi:hypothetical protein